MAAPANVLITCEHGGHRIPARFASRFDTHQRLLQTHRGWDPGTLLVARHLARRLHAPLVSATISRLLVDLNRSPHNPAVFSSISRQFTPEERRSLIERYHTPHWNRVRAEVDAIIAGGARCLHIGVHSFTPVLDGQVRTVDVGLLYDPARALERSFAARWKKALESACGDLRIRLNAPYRGKADGLVTALRREYAGARYIGIELELNQGLLTPAGDGFPVTLRQAITRSLRNVNEG